MRILAADFIVFEVADMERAKAFYNGILGLPVSFDETFWLEFDLPPTTLAVFVPRNVELDRDPIPGGTLALAVEEVSAAMEELKAKGVEFTTGIIDTPVCQSAYFKDPDGNALGLHARKDGTSG